MTLCRAQTHDLLVGRQMLLPQRPLLLKISKEKIFILLGFLSKQHKYCSDCIFFVSFVAERPLVPLWALFLYIRTSGYNQ